MAQTGPSPYWVFLTWLTMFWNKYRIVAVTDRGIVAFKATAFKPSFVKQPPMIERFDRNQQLGPCSGLWGKTTLGGERFHVHKRFHSDIAQADADLAAGRGAIATSAAANQGQAQPAAPHTAAPAAGAAPAGWYPDPHGTAAQRYWDGATWTDHTA